MIEDRRAGPPHAAIVAAIVLSAMVIPMLIGEQGEAITESIQELLGPVTLLLLTLGLLLAIQILSSGMGSSVAGIFSSGDPRPTGSPFGVLMFLLLVLLLLYSRVSIFSGDDDDECE